MVNILTSLNRTLIAGSILTILFVLYYISVDGLMMNISGNLFLDTLMY